MNTNNKRLPFSVGKKIKLARIDKRYTQEQLSKMANISRSLLAQWESGIRNPLTENFQKVANALDLSYDELLHYGDRPLPNQNIIIENGSPLEMRQEMIKLQIQYLSETGLEKLIRHADDLLKEGGENLLFPSSDGKNS